MTANVKNCGRQFRWIPLILRHIQIAGYIQMWPRLKVDVLDGEVAVIDLAGDDRLERRAFRKRVEAQHLAQLPAVRIATRGPIVPRLHIGEAGIRETASFV